MDQQLTNTNECVKPVTSEVNSDLKSTPDKRLTKEDIVPTRQTRIKKKPVYLKDYVK